MLDTRWRFITVVLLVSLAAMALRVGVSCAFLGLDAPPSASANPDQLDYEILAYHLSTGRGYTLADGTPTATRTPGTSLALLPGYLVTDRSFAAGRVWFALLSAATCALLAWAVRPVVSRGVAVVAAMMLAVYPGHFYYAMHFVSEVPFAFWIVLAAGCSLRAMTAQQCGWAWAIASGVSWGMAVLARPNVLLAAPVACLVVCAVMTPGWWRRAMLVGVQVVALAVTLSPWVVRNARVIGAPTLSTISGQGLWGSHNRITLEDPAYRGDWYPTSRLVDAEHPLVGDEVMRNQLAMSYGRAAIRDNITKMPVQTAAKLWRLVSPFMETTNRAVYWAFALSWIVAAPLMVLGVVAVWRRSRLIAMTLLMPVLGTIASTLVFYGSVRFRDALSPLIVAFAAVGVAAIWRWARLRESCFAAPCLLQQRHGTAKTPYRGTLVD